MWIMMNDAMVSAVADEADENKLVVRARVKGDLERFFKPMPVKVIAAAGTDYAYRCTVLREDFENALVDAASNITYENFKGSVAEEARHDAYLRCWAAMYALQNHCNPVLRSPYTKVGQKIGKGVSIKKHLGLQKYSSGGYSTGFDTY